MSEIVVQYRMDLIFKLFVFLGLLELTLTTVAILDPPHTNEAASNLSVDTFEHSLKVVWNTVWKKYT